MTKNDKENKKKNKEVNIRDESVVDDSKICAVKNAQKEIDKQKEKQKETNKKNSDDIYYVGFWSRYAAFVIDSIVAGMVALPFMFVAGFFSAMLKSIFNDSILVNVFLNFLVYIVELGVLSIYFIFMTYKFQATLGKMAVGVIVKKVDGETLSFKEVSIREFLKVVQIMFVSLPLVIVAFTQKKQGLHDLVVKSVVVCKNPRKGINKWVVGLVITIHIALIILAILVIFWITLMVFGGRQ